MHARKKRYDHSFIVEEEDKSSAKNAQVTSVNSASVNYVPSPARHLQQQLEEQLSGSVVAKPFEKYSGLSSIAIIVGSCLFLWAGLIALGLSIFN